MSDVKKGSLVGWKYRAALVMGKVIDIQGQKLILAPISKPDSRVTRQRVKVILESELDRADVEEALSHGGHTARAKLHTSSPKAQAMGLTTPHQVLAAACSASETAPHASFRTALAGIALALEALLMVLTA